MSLYVTIDLHSKTIAAIWGFFRISYANHISNFTLMSEKLKKIPNNIFMLMVN